MGMIKIEIGGSFKPSRPIRTFGASENGHAQAAAAAIVYLTEVLQDAIAQDHELHERGQKPGVGFGKPPK